MLGLAPFWCLHYFRPMDPCSTLNAQHWLDLWAPVNHCRELHATVPHHVKPKGEAPTLQGLKPMSFLRVSKNRGPNIDSQVIGLLLEGHPQQGPPIYGNCFVYPRARTTKRCTRTTSALLDLGAGTVARHTAERPARC